MKGHKRIGSVLVALALLAAVTTSCSGGNNAGPGSADRNVDIAGRWIPEEAPSAKLGPTFKPRSAMITFSGHGSWTASDGCNRYGGTYTIDGNLFRSPDTADYAGTGCVGGTIPYDLLLPRARRATLVDGDIELLDGSGKLLVRLRAAAGH